MVDRVPRSFGLHKLTLARMFVGVKSNLEKGESDIPLPAKAGSPLSRLLWHWQNVIPRCISQNPETLALVAAWPGADILHAAGLNPEQPDRGPGRRPSHPRKTPW